MPQLENIESLGGANAPRPDHEGVQQASFTGVGDLRMHGVWCRDFPGLMSGRSVAR